MKKFFCSNYKKFFKLIVCIACSIAVINASTDEINEISEIRSNNSQAIRSNDLGVQTNNFLGIEIEDDSNECKEFKKNAKLMYIQYRAEILKKFFENKKQEFNYYTSVGTGYLVSANILELVSVVSWTGGLCLMAISPIVYKQDQETNNSANPLFITGSILGMLSNPLLLLAKHCKNEREERLKNIRNFGKNLSFESMIPDEILNIDGINRRDEDSPA